MSDVKTTPAQLEVVEGHCAHAAVCPLTRLGVGDCARIRQLAATDSVNGRLRELGFCENQQVKIVSRHGNLICQICNARLGLSEQLAESILVEPVARPLR